MEKTKYYNRFIISLKKFKRWANKLKLFYSTNIKQSLLNITPQSDVAQTTLRINDRTKNRQTVSSNNIILYTSKTSLYKKKTLQPQFTHLSNECATTLDKLRGTRFNYARNIVSINTREKPLAAARRSHITPQRLQQYLCQPKERRRAAERRARARVAKKNLCRARSLNR